MRSPATRFGAWPRVSLGQLYTFITSDRCRQQFDAAEKASKDLQQLEVEDYAAHESMRRKRGVLFKSLDRALRDLTTNVASIVEADDSARSTAATRSATSD